MTNFKTVAAVAIAVLVALPVLPASAQRKPYDNYPENQVSTPCGSEIGYMPARSPAWMMRPRCG